MLFRSNPASLAIHGVSKYYTSKSRLIIVSYILYYVYVEIMEEKAMYPKLNVAGIPHIHSALNFFMNAKLLTP